MLNANSLEMKLLFSLLIASIYHVGFSQTDSSKKFRAITLNPVILSTEPAKIKKVHLKGTPSYNGLSQTNAVVSYFGDLPNGIIQSVSFYFNTGLANRLKKRLKIKYKDVELGLIIYKANSNSTLGELISQKEIKFIVPAKHRGSFKLDISSLQVQEKEIFIGFEVFSKLPKEENNIYVRYNERKSSKSFVKMNLPYMSNNWQKSLGPKPYELKLSLEILH